MALLLCKHSRWEGTRILEIGNLGYPLALNLLNTHGGIGSGFAHSPRLPSRASIEDGNEEAGELGEGCRGAEQEQLNANGGNNHTKIASIKQWAC